MNEGILHFLNDFAEREPLQFISTLVGIPLLILFMGVATFKRIHPVVVWFVLSGALFGFSQMFPENRDQRLSIGIMEGTLCAVYVWWWFSRVAPALRRNITRKRMDN
jgi:hypothetical protein